MHRRLFLTGALAGLGTVAALQQIPLLLSPPEAPDLAQVLAEMVPSVLDVKVDLAHYARFFRQRLQHNPGHRRAYQALVDAWRESPALSVQQLLQRQRADWFRQQVMEHFARTDAWIFLGYPSWPGLPDPGRL